MRIGVVSDTHSREIPKQLFDDFKNVDLIIHAGDFCTKKDLDQFARIAEVKGVYGNCDDRSIRAVLPEELTFQCEGRTFKVFHGEGPSRRVLDCVTERFRKEKPDVVIYGHSHAAYNGVIDKTLYFNPGSPNDTITADYCSYGILNITQEKVTGEIIKL